MPSRIAPARCATTSSTTPTTSAVASPPLLAFDKVGIFYGEGGRRVRATEAVSLHVREHERYVLLGPSGCGKSTLLKAAAGFITPASGEIRLDDRVVRGPGPDRMVVFQEFDQLPPWKTVLGNVMFPLRVTGRLGRRAADARAGNARPRALH